MINFNQLRIFYETAKCLSCTQAAKNLYITQPAVTTQVKLFEEYCGLKLFKRRGRSIHLTDEGRTLLGYAKRIFEYEREVEGAIEDMKKLKRGVLRLGTTKTYARYFMPFLITSFREVYPDIKIHLDEGSSVDMIHSLLDFTNELAVIARAEEHPDVHFIPFSREDLVAVVGPNHYLARKKTIPFLQIAREPIIMKETGSGTRRVVNGLFARHRCTPNVLMETGNTEFIKQLVMRGEGFSFLVKEAVERELREGSLTALAIRGQRVHLDVSIAYLKGQYLSPPAQAFLDTLIKIGEGRKPHQGIRNMMAGVLDQWNRKTRDPRDPGGQAVRDGGGPRVPGR